MTNGNRFFAAVRRALSPQFLATMIVLGIAALSLGAATQFMRLYFKKEPVAIAKPLEEIPAKMGPWVQVSVDESLDPEMLDVLGTKQYIFRDYVDSRLLAPDELDGFRNKTANERALRLSKLQLRLPEAVVRLGVTYYTGMVDTVAHIPDRCYVANGDVPESKEFPLWKMANQQHEPIDVRVSLIHFEDGGAGAAGGGLGGLGAQREGVTKNVAYFFQCNGAYEYDPITGVRIRLQNLLERHAYYAKVEVMTQMKDRPKSDQVMQDFLSSALPEVERCLPDWKAVQAGTYKPNSKAGENKPADGKSALSRL